MMLVKDYLITARLITISRVHGDLLWVQTWSFFQNIYYSAVCLFELCPYLIYLKLCLRHYIYLTYRYSLLFYFISYSCPIHRNHGENNELIYWRNKIYVAIAIHSFLRSGFSSRSFYFSYHLVPYRSVISFLSRYSLANCSNSMSGNLERTYLMIKPDGVQRGLVGEIIKRFEQKGFKLVALKFVQVFPNNQFTSPTYCHVQLSTAN